MVFFFQSEGDASSAPAERTSEADSHPDRVMSVGSTPANSAPIGQQLTSAGSGTVASGHRRLGGRVAKSGHCVKQGHVVSHRLVVQEGCFASNMPLTCYLRLWA